MSQHALHTFMDQVTNEMASEYDRIFTRSAEDPGTAGDEGEGNWAALLKDWLPPTYNVETKGRLVSYNGVMSPQIDVVVLKPAYPKKLLEKKVWLVDGVAAAFECKNTLTAVHVTESIKRCKIFKELCKPREGSPRREIRSPLIYGILAHSHSWKSVNSKPIENISRAIAAAGNSITHPRFEVDLICVADLATWSLMYITYLRTSVAGTAEATFRQGFEGGDWGAVTSLICSAVETERQNARFRPIGALLGI